MHLLAVDAKSNRGGRTAGRVAVGQGAQRKPQRGWRRGDFE
jgi:hypothetical protein